MPRPKKNSVKTPKPIKAAEEMKEQADGKDYGRAHQIQVSQKKSLNEIWGRKFSPFKTNDPEEYRAKLRVMNKIDLQRECIRVGVNASDSRENMIELLVKSCKGYVALARTSTLQPKQITVSERSKRILAKQDSVR